MSEPLRVLLVEDYESDAKLVTMQLAKMGRRVVSERVENAREMRTALDRGPWDLVLSDWSMPQFSGLGALRVLKETHLDIPFIIVSGTVGEETAVAAIREGADDYVLKDKLSRLPAAVERALRDREERVARRRAEGLLRVQDARFRAMLEKSFDVVTLKNAEHEFVYVSPAVSRMLGYEPAEVIGHQCLELVHPDDRDEVTRGHAELLATPGHTTSLEYRCLHRDGSTRWLRATETNLLEDVDVRGVIGNVHDITERRNAESLLRVSEERYRKIIETTSDGVLVVDGPGNVIFANGRVAEILGYTVDELRAMQIYAWLEPSDHAAVRAVIESRQQGTRGVSERVLVRKDGMRRFVHIDSTAIELAQGTAVLAMITDVTERRAAQVALRASEARFQRLADSGLVAIASADLSGRIIDVNDTLVSMFGYSRAELLGGMSWLAMTPPGWTEPDQRALASLHERGVMDPYEKELYRKDGVRVPVLMGGSMLDSDTTVVFLFDLTAQKHAEAALRQSSQQLLQAQKMDAMGRLAGGVAHDFNNLLSVILSYTELLLDDMPADAQGREEIDEIRNAGVRAAALTRQLLLFSRQQVVTPVIVDVGKVIVEMERMLQRILGEDVELRFRPGPASCCVRIDAGQLEQVFMNLVVNARDAMPRGGTLTIETQVVDLDERYAATHFGVVSGRYVMFAVADTGVGMDADTLARIFEPFFTTKARGKGTGLGLSTVFGIVQNAGGTVWPESEPGVGSTFKVYLPAVSAEAEGLIQVPEASSLRGTETILIAEDETSVRLVAAGILRRQGYHVLVSADVDDAQMIASKYGGEIELLLTDVVMPRLSGPELAVRLQPVRPAMAVLYMSGYTDDSIVRHGLLDASRTFLQKPFTPETLARKVREVLDARRKPSLSRP